MSSSDSPLGSATQPPPRRGGSAAWLVGILALLVALAVGGLGWWHVYVPLQGIVGAAAGQGERVAGLETAAQALGQRFDERHQELTTSLEDERRELRAALDELRAVQTGFADRLQTHDDWREDIDDALHGMRRYLGQTRRDWLLNEAEYLLVIANRRLYLEADVATAIAALEFADDSLRELDDTRWLPVRRRIAEEVRLLSAVTPVDIVGIDLAIRDAAQDVGSLPLSGFQRSVSGAATPVGGKWWQRVRALLEGIVNIERVDDPPQPLLPPGQRFFLSQNLALKLEGARLGLLRRDAALFRSRLREADALAARYFEPRDGAVQALRRAIAGWLAQPVGAPLPQIGEALAELKGRRGAGTVLGADSS